MMGKRSKYWPEIRDSILHGKNTAYVHGTGLCVQAVVGMHKAGESIKDIADWYEVPVQAVRQAIEFDAALAQGVMEVI